MWSVSATRAILFMMRMSRRSIPAVSIFGIKRWATSNCPFNKDAKRIILSHSRTFEDEAKNNETEQLLTEKKVTKKAKATLGDIEALSELKDQMISEAKDDMLKAQEAPKKTRSKAKEKTEDTEDKE